MSTAWSTYFPGPIVGDNQYTAQVVRVADRKGRSRGFVISGHRGLIWVGSSFSFFFFLLDLFANVKGRILGRRIIIRW